MRILICAHTLEIGGSQINAIELAAAVAELPGHDTAMYAPDGVLADDIRARGLPLYRAPETHMVPSVRSSARMTALAASGKFDLVHAYEWNTTLDALAGPGLVLGTPILSTILSMDVPYLIPRSVPMIVGTRQMYREELRWRPDVHLLEPPVDTVCNAPGVTGKAEHVRAEWGISATDLLVVVVGRLAARLKLEGLLAAIAAIDRLAPRYPVRLLIVGDGPERPRVAAAAALVNTIGNRPVVQLVGERADPKPFYDAADVIIGMGASALRGLAFAKPLVVQGERGYWETLTPETAETFLRQGWYGIGDSSDARQRCESKLEGLLAATAEARASLGTFGRGVVEQRYSLTAAAQTLEGIYELVADRRVSVANRVRDQFGAGFVMAKHHAALLGHRARASAPGRKRS
ncbi:glycosyltransferase [Cryobacterium sp. CG_9.6]|uniref:glycosyltransferase n=1 Tax=Cryobacterium sp. CG_9.6 TaxID=2760710 RepID=UPI002475862F|nr:glycosyltransferase [Cryobacterium sp. CG_9.6]MDH6238281.1 glycosyltransferase involved in cell wall biosynthesis [Cryobacterium sp. CG_9.6]